MAIAVERGPAVLLRLGGWDDEYEEDELDEEDEVEYIWVVEAVKVVEMQVGTRVMFKPVHELTEIEVAEEKQELMTVEDLIMVVWEDDREEVVRSRYWTSFANIVGRKGSRADHRVIVEVVEYTIEKLLNLVE